MALKFYLRICSILLTILVVDTVGAIATLKSDISLNWNDHVKGEYTLDQMKNDFGNIQGTSWDRTKATITVGKNNTLGCRIKLLHNMLLHGGFTANSKIVLGQEYEVDFDMKFDSAFYWSRGGKVGFGFKIGQGNSGCRPAWNGKGGSIRLMWYTDNDGHVILRPYVYHYHQPKECGDMFGKMYPKTENLTRDTWYHVHMYVKSNTGNNKDGWIQIIINDTPLINQTIQWTADDEYRTINVLTFHNFRGGMAQRWKAPTTGYVYNDNLVVKKLS